jgi:2-dehydro-3-deoxyphosphooctonate aldolase (KDO 8-P synthase)
MSKKTLHKGSCTCGQVRVEARGEPYRVGICHCLNCRKAHAGPFNFYAVYAPEAVTVSGEVIAYASSDYAVRFACKTCGAPIYSTYGRDDEFYIHPGSLEEIDAFTPTYELWTIHREPWLPEFPSVIHRYEKGRPEWRRREVSSAAIPLTAIPLAPMVQPGNTMNEAMKPAPAAEVSAGSATFGNERPFALMAGPCVLESRAHALETAAALKEISQKLGIGLVYKSSFDKANRTSAASARGLGLNEALPIFAEVGEATGLAVITDVHKPDQCPAAAEAVDVLQIPAFLCRQTDLLVAAAKTGKPVNVKKGQFLAPWDMRHVVAKVVGAGNPNVLVTERGVSFGYNTLVSDMRALPILAETGAPVVFDATHSVQQPGGQGASSGGERRFVSVLARAAVAVGVAGLFIETHQDPDKAPSDGPNMVSLKELEPLLSELIEIDRLTKRSRHA